MRGPQLSRFQYRNQLGVITTVKKTVAYVLIPLFVYCIPYNFIPLANNK